jgi:hypothetical protein
MFHRHLLPALDGHEIRSTFSLPMRSIQKLESEKWLSRYDGPNRCGASFPRIEYPFQRGWEKGSGDSWFGGGAPRGRSALNRLTQEVLRGDASRSFGIETAVLALITLVSAWPIAIMISAIIRLLE